ncbi:CHAT domain-containing protein, partial [Mycena vulgaris]
LSRFQQRGDVADINEAVQLHREAHALRPASHPGRVTSLNNLGISLQARFQLKGDAADINKALQLHSEALVLRAASHPDRTNTLKNLGNSVIERFQMRGDATDIDKAVQLHREALALLPVPHSGRASALNNLAVSVLMRFQQRGDVGDIDEAVQLHREGLALRPAPHPGRSTSLSNLASTLHARFEQRGDATDIDEPVQLHRETLALFPTPHPARDLALDNVGVSVSMQFRQRGNVGDIGEAVQLHGEALALLPAHPHRAISLTNLANSVLERYRQTGDTEDIDEAVKLHREALALRRAPHPHRDGSLNNLGSCFLTLYIRTSEADLITSAITALEEASADSSAPLLLRFKSAIRWASAAHQTHHSSALDAYKIALGLLPRLAALDLDIRSRQEILVVAQSHDLESAAATCASDLGQYETALELLETGCSVFWSQSLQLRTSLDDLRVSHPVLAHKLTELSWQLEQSSFRDTRHNLQSDSYHRVMSLEAEGLNCRRLNEEWATTVESIRSSAPGFEDFMPPRPIRRLRRAAEHGPVVVLNAGTSSCRALILDSLGNVQCVDLPAITRADVNKMAELIQALVSHSTGTFLAILKERGDALETAHRLIGRVVYDENSRPDDLFIWVLMELWTAAVKPVLISLKIRKSDDPPSIWWCPTGPFTFLPIHSAGIYRNSSIDECVMDYVISSYTPTLTALLSPPFPLFTSNDPLRSTVIIQPNTPGRLTLPSTKDELRKIEGQIPNEWLTKLGSTASLDTVSPHLRTSSIIHFACHGIQDTKNPLQSALIIGGERLTVAQIMKQSGTSGGGTMEKHMGVAFLSACETSMGDKKLPDEAMHLAATLLFAGFRSVVATMW